MVTPTKRFFVLKCYELDALYRSMENSEWACTDRETGPQPWEILREAFADGPVILFFSVNKRHGWHGYSRITSPPETVGVQRQFSCNNKPVSQSVKDLEDHLWHTFKIEWVTLFLRKHGEKCLDFKNTTHLLCKDKLTPINKARNMQEVDTDTGTELCKALDIEYQLLSERLQREEELKRERKPKPFLSLDNNLNPSWELVWQTLINKVSSMGKIILACPCGSQRYNLHNAESDVDMFIIYQAPTSLLLGFNPHKHTIKSTDEEKYDYTVLELQRFCELLIAGDPRCVECLFLEDCVVYQSSVEYKELCDFGKYCLSMQCVTKYVNDATGARGTKLLDKWEKSGEATKQPMPKKTAKLFYIIIRLLQNALDIVKHHTLKVYRLEDSQERQLLLQTRSCDFTYGNLKDKVYLMEKEIRMLKDSRHESNPECNLILHEKLETWMVRLRYNQLKKQFE